MAALLYNGSDSCVAHGIRQLKTGLDLLVASIAALKQVRTEDEAVDPVQLQGKHRDRRLHTIWIQQMEQEPAAYSLILTAAAVAAHSYY